MADNFFVGVKDSNETRKEILLVMRDVLGLVRQESELRKIKMEKLAAVQELQKELDALARISRKLRAKLPKVALKRQRIVAPAKKEEGEAAPEERPVEGKAKVERKPVGKSKLQLLEEELAAVESKLKEL